MYKMVAECITRKSISQDVAGVRPLPCESIGPSSLNAQFQKFLKFLRKPFKSDHYSEGSEEAAAAPAHFHDALLRTIVSPS